jgi:hypothetical protein
MFPVCVLLYVGSMGLGTHTGSWYPYWVLVPILLVVWVFVPILPTRGGGGCFHIQ